MHRFLLTTASVLVFAGIAQADVVQIDELPTGTTVDLSGFNTGVPIAFDDPAFLAAGIASITVSNDPSTNSEFYDGGIFGAGRALFGTEDGELIALDQGPTVDFGSPTFTIDLLNTVDAFGFRIADTSQSFATPQVTFFLDGVSVADFLIDGNYNAATEFGFTSEAGFDQVVIDVDTVGTGFGFDGAGLTDLTVGGSVGDPITPPPPAVVPLPATLPLLLGALAIIGLRRRNH